jgi:hypothetical protein
MANVVHLLPPEPSPPGSPSNGSPEVVAVTQPDKGGKNLAVSAPVKDKGTPTTSVQVLTVEFDLKLIDEADANCAEFLINLLKAVQESDPKAGLLPVQSSSKCALLRSQADFPANLSRTEAFVKQYIGSSCVRGDQTSSSIQGKSMRGKIRIQTQCKLSTLKNKRAVQKLNGKNQLVLHRHTLPCGIRKQVGFLLNTITRHDLAELLQARLRNLGLLTELQIEVVTIFCDRAPVKLYRVMASSKADVESIRTTLLQFYPELHAKNMIFFPSDFWTKLDSKQKNGYLRLHAQFQDHHSGLLLRGIKNSEMRISSSDILSSNNDESIHQMVKNRKCANGIDFLFTHVDPSVNDLMELQCSKDHEAEAKKWLADALPFIYKRAVFSDVAKIFCDPVKVLAKMESKAPPASTPRGDTPFRAPQAVSTKLVDPLLDRYLKFDTSLDPIKLVKFKKVKPKKSPPAAPKRIRIVFTLGKTANAASAASASTDRVKRPPPAPAIKTQKRRKRKKTKKSTVSSVLTALPMQDTTVASSLNARIGDSSSVPTKTDEGSKDSDTIESGNLTADSNRSWAAVAAGRHDGSSDLFSVGRNNSGVRGTPPRPSILVSPKCVPPLVSQAVVDELEKKFQAAVDVLEKKVTHLLARLAQFEKSAPTSTTSSVGVSDETELALPPPPPPPIVLDGPPSIVLDGISSPRRRRKSRPTGPGTPLEHHPPNRSLSPTPSKRSRASTPSPSSNSYAVLAEQPDEDEDDEMAGTARQVEALSLTSVTDPPPAEVGVDRGS